MYHQVNNHREMSKRKHWLKRSLVNHHIIVKMVKHNGFEYLSDMVLSNLKEHRMYPLRLKNCTLNIAVELLGIKKERARQIFYVAYRRERNKIITAYNLQHLPCVDVCLQSSEQ